MCVGALGEDLRRAEALRHEISLLGHDVRPGVRDRGVGDPARRAAAIVKAVTHYQDASILADVSKDLGEPMVGRNISQMPETEKIAGRGW